jgi:hypothetical protein
MKAHARRLTGAIALLAVSGAVVFAESIDSLEYKRWSGFKPESWVTHKVTSEVEGKKSEMELTTKLLEVSPEKLVLETTETVGGKAKTLPKKEYPAKIEKKEHPAKKGEKPPEKTEGEEEIEVAGKKMKCHWECLKAENKGETSEVKTWYTDEIPGKIARHELKLSGPKGFTKESVATKWEKK